MHKPLLIIWCQPQNHSHNLLAIQQGYGRCPDLLGWQIIIDKRVDPGFSPGYRAGHTDSTFMQRGNGLVGNGVGTGEDMNLGEFSLSKYSAGRASWPS